MSNTLRPEILRTAEWLQEAVAATQYGEVTVVIKIHDGQPSIEERTITTRTKTPTGNPGGRHDSAR